MKIERHLKAEPLAPIALIAPDTAEPRPRMTRGQVFAEAIKALPNLTKLCTRLLRDPLIPRRTKVLLGAAGIYVVSPLDLIPEVLFPIVGRVDDALVLALALNRLFDAVEPEVLEEYWDGEPDTLAVVTALIAWGADLMPRPLKRLLA
jgi:uncharacterized membrane protein YkvA (DUF1232 family)